MLKYALRYTPLLILALLLVSLHSSVQGMAQQKEQVGQSPTTSPGGISSALYSIAALPDGEAWAVGGSFSAQPASSGTPQGFPVPSSGIILHYSNNTWTPFQLCWKTLYARVRSDKSSSHFSWSSRLH